MNELIVHLKTNDKTPLYEQIYRHIKSEIQSGAMKPGIRLPSTRALSKNLEISRSTVELAYEQLLSEGYIEVIPCKGFYVAQLEGIYQLGPVSLETDRDNDQEREKYQYDFTPNGVDLNSFPYRAWRKLSKDILLNDRAELFRLGDPQGEFALRQMIAGYLHQARGVGCRPEQIVVGAGSDYMLLFLNTLIGSNHRIAFENPTYRRAYRIFKQLGFETSTVEMDQNGISVDQLKELSVNLVYVMPSHQYPLGTVMPMKRRMELMAWAQEKTGRYIIEDDYDSEFRYRGRPIPALQGYDEKDKVIYLGTFSKSIAPAIRISYMVLPEPILALYKQNKKILHSTVSKVDQLILERFIRDGYYERHLNKTRALYKNRHDTLLTSLKPLLSRCRLSGEHAGVHLLLTFFDGRTEAELLAEAAKKGIKVYGLSEYDVAESAGGEATVLLGYANMPEEKIREAAGILAQIW